MAREEEVRFALGFGVTCVALAAAVLALNLFDTSEKDRRTADTSAQPKPDVLIVDRLGDFELTPDSGALPDTVSSAALIDGGTEGLSAGAVVDTVPLGYFDKGSNPVDLPEVIEKYIARVDRGSRFMARLESVVAIAPGTVDETADDPALAVSFQNRTTTDTLSFNAKRSTSWLEANFDLAVPVHGEDVLVDARRKGDDGQIGERHTLFFASIQNRDNLKGFAFESAMINETVDLFVYDVVDGLPLLGRVTLRQGEN